MIFQIFRKIIKLIVSKIFIVSKTHTHTHTHIHPSTYVLTRTRTAFGTSTTEFPLKDIFLRCNLHKFKVNKIAALTNK